MKMCQFLLISDIFRLIFSNIQGLELEDNSENDYKFHKYQVASKKCIENVQSISKHIDICIQYNAVISIPCSSQ